MAEVGTKSMEGEGNYDISFMGLPNKSYYLNALNRSVKHLDARPAMQDVMVKSFTTSSGGSGTAGNAMIPVNVDSVIVDTSRKITPLTELIPRVTNMGITADYNRVTAKSYAYTAAEDAAQNDGSATRARVSKSIKYLYSVGRVTGQANAAVPAYTLLGFQSSGSGNSAANPFSNVGVPNALDQEVTLAARHLKELEENLIINGNSTTSGISGNPNGTEFDGIITLQSTTNMTNLAGAELQWSNVESVIETAFVAGGRPNFGLASPRVVTRLRSIMIDTFRFNPNSLTSEIAFGIPASVVINTSLGPIPVIQSQFMPNTAAAGRIYFLDMDYIEMRVLQDMTFERLAKTNDSDKFMLKMYECLIMRAPEFNSGIYGIA